MNNLFNRKEYLEDRLKFCYVDLNRKLELARVFTDDDTYLGVYTSDEVPVWLWTQDNLSKEKLEELKQKLTNLLDLGNYEVASRLEVFEYLKSAGYPYLESNSYFELGFLECKNAVKPRECDGYLDRVRQDELELLAQLVYLEKKELPLADLTKEEALEKAKDLLTDNTFYVWRNANNKLVAFLNYRQYDDFAKLGNVYTVLDERRKGYCVNLVYEVTKKLLESGLRVMLYTDYKYPNSNNAYKKVGYEDKGYLVQYKLKR